MAFRSWLIVVGMVFAVSACGDVDAADNEKPPKPDVSTQKPTDVLFLGPCENHPDCEPTQFCAPNDQCVEKKADGEWCMFPVDCLSGNCKNEECVGT